MKLCTFSHDGRRRVGVVQGDEVVDLAAAAPELPPEMVHLLEGGPEALRAAARAAGGARARLALASVSLAAPVLRPPKFLAHGLRLRTWVNGELRQDSSTKQPIFDCFALVEHLSTAFTLEPGDVVSTGTPGGVGIALKPPSLLQVGDAVRVEIEGLGAIENRVIDEPDTALL